MPVTERFFILTPTPTRDTRKNSLGTEQAVYLDASGTEMLWSGDFPIPAIGTRVYVTMNGIGWADVVGYFESCGYVGVMTKPVDPPEWLRRQQRENSKDTTKPRWYRDGVGCEFGAEIALEKPQPRTRTVAGKTA